MRFCIDSKEIDLGNSRSTSLKLVSFVTPCTLQDTEDNDVETLVDVSRV